MDKKELQLKLRSFHRQNRVLWAAVLGGMLMLILVTLILRFNGSLSNSAVAIDTRVENLLFLITLALLLLSFYLKRHYLVPAKMVERASKKEISLTSDAQEFISNLGNEVEIIAKILLLTRRYFMLVWSVANILLLFGFISYLLAGQFQTFLIYAVIGVYSMIINFPSFAFILKCLDLLNIQLDNV